MREREQDGMGQRDAGYGSRGGMREEGGRAGSRDDARGGLHADHHGDRGRVEYAPGQEWNGGRHDGERSYAGNDAMRGDGRDGFRGDRFGGRDDPGMRRQRGGGMSRGAERGMAESGGGMHREGEQGWQDASRFARGDDDRLGSRAGGYGNAGHQGPRGTRFGYDDLLTDEDTYGSGSYRGEMYRGGAADANPYVGGESQGSGGRGLGVYGLGEPRSDSVRPTGGFRGRGPKNYIRSDDRIREDVSERLAQDDYVDASAIEVAVSDGKVSLTGTVEDRRQKHRAEDIVESCGGVGDIDNQIRVQRAQSGTTGTSVAAGGKSASAGATGAVRATKGGDAR